MIYLTFKAEINRVFWRASSSKAFFLNTFVMRTAYFLIQKKKDYSVKV